MHCAFLTPGTSDPPTVVGRTKQLPFTVETKNYWSRLHLVQVLLDTSLHRQDLYAKGKLCASRGLIVTLDASHLQVRTQSILRQLNCSQHEAHLACGVNPVLPSIQRIQTHGTRIL